MINCSRYNVDIIYINISAIVFSNFIYVHPLSRFLSRTPYISISAIANFEKIYDF